MASKGGINDIAVRYASALYDLADESKALDAVADDLRNMQGLLNESDDLRRMVRSPVLSRNDQQKAISAVADKMGASDLSKKFFEYLAAHRRLFAMPVIARAYLRQLADRRGEVTAAVTAARALSAAQVKSVEDALEKSLGKKVAVDYRVDPAVIGGLIVQVGSRMVDASLATQLQKLKLAMKGA